MKLKDGDALIEALVKLYCENCERRKGIKNGKRQFIYEIGDAPCGSCGIDDAVDAIDDAPTIEYKPKHGRWIRHIDDLFPEESMEECSVCHKWQYLDGDDDNYCPNCGADMREVKE